MPYLGEFLSHFRFSHFYLLTTKTTKKRAFMPSSSRYGMFRIRQGRRHESSHVSAVPPCFPTSSRTLDRTLVIPVSPGVRHSLLEGFGMRLKRGFHRALVRLLSTTSVGVLSFTPLSTTLLSQCLAIRMRTRAKLVKTKAVLPATKQQLPTFSDLPR